MANAIVIDPEDDVATLLQAAAPGETVVWKTSDDHVDLRTCEAVPEGHKVALKDIPKGTVVRKYGYAIARAERDIRKGEHVHTHNLMAVEE